LLFFAVKGRGEPRKRLRLTRSEKHVSGRRQPWCDSTVTCATEAASRRRQHQSRPASFRA